jgi:mannose-1-phosphate guanylyltransferase/phosphomannomutase
LTDRAATHESALADRETFFIVNGDTLTDVNLDEMLSRHRQSGARVTMALIANPRPDKYGGVLVSGGWVTGFTRAGSAEPCYHFIGVQVADAGVFSTLEDGIPFESVNWLYRQLLAQDPHSIGAFISDASFRDIGTPADYLATSLGLAEREGDRMVSSRGTRIDPTARITRSAVWDDVTIGASAELTECILADGVSIPAGARYRRVAIVRDPATTGGELLLRPLD